MQSENKSPFEQALAIIERNEKATRAKARAELKFTPLLKIKKHAELKFMFPFQYMKKFNPDTLQQLKEELFYFTLIYTGKAFSDSFLATPSEKQYIIIKLADFRKILGYRCHIPSGLQRRKKGTKKYLALKPSIPFLEPFNYTKAKQRGQKPLQYKAFTLKVVLDFLNTFKTPSIPFLFYVLNLFSHSNAPRIQHNASNLLKACKITLKQGKQKAIDRLNKYLLFLHAHGIISNTDFQPLNVESLTETKSLNIQLKLF